MQRYLRFTKLSGPALQAIARVVDTDDEFRARVAAAVDENGVGRAGVLWLARPEGWSDELSRLEAEVAASAAASAEARDERDARRRLASAKAAAERANKLAQAHAAKLDELRLELAGERARRSSAEQRARALEASLLQEQEARGAALRKLQEADARIAELAAEARTARTELADLAAERREAAAAAARPVDDGRARLVEAVSTAAERARALAGELQELERSVSGETGPEVAERRDERARRQAKPVTAAVARRQPVPLPPGLRDDSVDAVDHLLRVSDMLLLVDGYNVSMVGWPDVPVREQRKRLLVALEEKALRTGTPIEVVFDGAEIDAVAMRAQGRPLVRVRFSPPGVEADDVLLDLVAQLPLRRPITVVSSDKRVRQGARMQGANLLHARQLIDALRR